MVPRNKHPSLRITIVILEDGFFSRRIIDHNYLCSITSLPNVGTWRKSLSAKLFESITTTLRSGINEE